MGANSSLEFVALSSQKDRERERERAGSIRLELRAMTWHLDSILEGSRPYMMHVGKWGPKVCCTIFGASLDTNHELGQEANHRCHFWLFW